MTKKQLEKQLNMLMKDLTSADKRCRRIAEGCGIENNELISFAVEQTRLVLEYIESLKGEDK